MSSSGKASGGPPSVGPVYRGLRLDPFQVEAVEALEAGASVLVSAPTGAGKTLVAEYALDQALRTGRRAFYTAPIKALSNQKFRDFTAVYGDRVGITTGDVTIRPGAQVVIMTTEIFRNTIFDDPARLADVEYVIFDEVHYMDDAERGTVWEESILFAPRHIRFVCLSATVPNVEAFAAWIREVREGPLRVVVHAERPVPLRSCLNVQGVGICEPSDLRAFETKVRTSGGAKFYGRSWADFSQSSVAARVRGDAEETEDWMESLLDFLQAKERLPCLYFAFDRKGCEARAAHAGHRNLLAEDERARMRDLVDGLYRQFQVDEAGGGAELYDLLLRGVAYHHAGMLPTLKEVVERCFTSGLVKLLFATETFALGVNMPARTVVLHTLHKFDGVKRAYLKCREFQQMSGRAGRRGIDPVGYVVANVEWPHARSDAVERILSGEPEPIRSQFSLSYSTLLNLYRRLRKDLLTACERSFANFLSRRSRSRRGGRRGGGGASAAGYRGMVEQVEARLDVMRRLRYIGPGHLTEKGEFATRIHGYELPLTELIWQGVLDPLSEDQVNAIFTALVFSSRRRVWYAQAPQGFLGKSRGRLRRIAQEIRHVEEEAGVDTWTERPDFQLTGPVRAWSQGCSLEDLADYTDAEPGDLVRAFRRAVQAQRQLYMALAKGHPLRDRLRRCMDRLSRGVVDAEHYLRMETE